jgi:RNA polymerase sigma factor (sigma-70 family)
MFLSVHPARYSRAAKARPGYKVVSLRYQQARGLVHNTLVSEPVHTHLISATPAVGTAALISPASESYLLQCIGLIAQHMSADPAAHPESASSSRASAEHAFSVLYDHTVQRVHALVKRYVKDDGVAQEVTEDVFFMAWSQAARFDVTRGNPIAWLLTIARSKALDVWRQQASQKVHFDSDTTDDLLAETSARGTPLDLLEAVDQKNALHAALAQVSPAARQMLSLAFFQGLTHSEISEHLKTPLGTVKTTLRRALLSMREILQTQCATELPAGLLVEE